MNIEQFIPLHTICTCYQIEISFLNSLNEIGLIEINTIDADLYIHEDHIRSIEKIIRLHHELDINMEGIDVVFNLLNKIDLLQQELKGTKSRLKMYED